MVMWSKSLPTKVKMQDQVETGSILLRVLVHVPKSKPGLARNDAKKLLMRVANPSLDKCEKRAYRFKRFSQDIHYWNLRMIFDIRILTVCILPLEMAMFQRPQSSTSWLHPWEQKIRIQNQQWMSCLIVRQRQDDQAMQSMSKEPMMF